MATISFSAVSTLFEPEDFFGPSPQGRALTVTNFARSIALIS